MKVSEHGEISFHLNSFHSRFPLPPLILLKNCKDVLENWHFPRHTADLGWLHP